MELREVEVFLTLAEELHFGHTAERLFLSQPRVSQTVRALERAIGGKLFERSSRRVALTPLGERLRDDLWPGYEQIRKAIANATDLARGLTGTLRICVPTYPMAGRWYSEIVREFQDRHPTCRVITVEAFPGDFTLLRRGVYDVMCHRLPVTDPDLAIGPTLGVEDSVLLVRTDGAIAARGHATLEDLADHAVMGRGDVPQPLYEQMYPSRTPSGRPVPRGPVITTSTDVLHLVAQGRIVHPTVASFYEYYRHPEVVPVPLRDAGQVTSVLVRLAARTDARIMAFFDVAADVAERYTER